MAIACGISWRLSAACSCPADSLLCRCTPWFRTFVKNGATVHVSDQSEQKSCKTKHVTAAYMCYIIGKSGSLANPIAMNLTGISLQEGLFDKIRTRSLVFI
jgi:hypothetical protein